MADTTSAEDTSTVGLAENTSPPATETSMAVQSSAVDTSAHAAKGDKIELEERPPLTEPTAGPSSNAPIASSITIKVMNASVSSTAAYNFTFSPAYLRKRGISVDNDDPWNMSIAQVKECMFTDWPTEYVANRPASSQDIRLIHFGMYMVDEQLLKDTRFTRGSINVVHLVVRPRTPVDPNEIKNQVLGGQGGNPASHDDERAQRSSCCCVVL